MIILAISGFKRSGKDSAAGFLVKEHGAYRVAFADKLKDMTAEEYGVSRSHMDDPTYKEAPILTLPVTPKDDFTLNLAKILFKEFRTETGLQVSEYMIDNSGAFVGLLPTKSMFTDNLRPVQLYWTARSLAILKGSVNRAVRSDFWVQSTIDKIEQMSNPKTSGYNIQAYNKFVIPDLRYRSEAEQLKQAFGKDLVTVRINRFDSVNSTDASENDLNSYNFNVIIENKGTIEEFYQKVNKLV